MPNGIVLIVAPHLHLYSSVPKYAAPSSFFAFDGTSDFDGCTQNSFAIALTSGRPTQRLPQIPNISCVPPPT